MNIIPTYAKILFSLIQQKPQVDSNFYMRSSITVVTNPFLRYVSICGIGTAVPTPVTTSCARLSREKLHLEQKSGNISLFAYSVQQKGKADIPSHLKHNFATLTLSMFLGLPEIRNRNNPMKFVLKDITWTDSLIWFKHILLMKNPRINFLDYWNRK